MTTKQKAFALFIFLAALFAALTGNAQHKVVLSHDNIYMDVPKAPHDSICRCGTYQAKDGKQYPIFQSAKGKTYIWRTSKNGNSYRQYIKM